MALGGGTSILFRNGAIQLEEFPALFTMEAHTGFSGVAFSSAWFVLSAIYVRSIWDVQLVGCALAVGASFLLLAWLSTTFSNSTRERLGEIGSDASRRERLGLRVRKQIALLSGLYVIVCCFLIFLTGGATSPFTAFYIMIFTLTIGKNKVPYPGFLVLGYFVLGILIACISNLLWPWPISSPDMQTIHESGFQAAMHLMFIIASLMVPTVSAYLVILKERRKQPAERGGVQPA